MVKKKTILVACGTAIATSTVVAKAIEEALEEKDIYVNLRQCKASEVPSLVDNADLIVTTTPVSVDKDIPVIQTLAFLTGIGKEEVLKQIIDYITEE